MADDAAAGGARKRTFRKFTFRGVDLDQLLSMSTDELVDLFHARARRKFQRGLKRKPLALIKKLRAAKKQAESGEKPEPVRTHLRNMIIVPEMIGSIVGVYNGKTFNQASYIISAAAYAHSAGLCAALCSWSCPVDSLCTVCTGRNQARHGGTLLGRVLHLLQASQAWKAWHWCNPFFQIYPFEIDVFLVKQQLLLDHTHFYSVWCIQYLKSSSDHPTRTC